jgi:prevent-host-death family protein
VVDDTHSHRFLRDRCKAVAQECGMEFLIVFVDTDLATIDARRASNAINLARPHIDDDVFAAHRDGFQYPARDEPVLAMRSQDALREWLIAQGVRPRVSRSFAPDTSCESSCESRASHPSSHSRRAPMKFWPVQDAKARFSEMMVACEREGPQVVTKRGVEAAVLVPFAEWRRLSARAPMDLKALLLADEGRCDDLVPQRRGR